jgi:hypothetical protein
MTITSDFIQNLAAQFRPQNQVQIAKPSVPAKIGVQMVGSKEPTMLYAVGDNETITELLDLVSGFSLLADTNKTYTVIIEVK